MAYNTPVTSTTNYGVVKVGAGIDVTDGVISISEGVINTVLVNDVNGQPYNVSSTDYYIGVVGTVGTITINLPVGTQGRELIIKSEFDNISDIQITPQSGEYVEGVGAGLLIDVIFGLNPSVTLVFRDTNWNIV